MLTKNINFRNFNKKKKRIKIFKIFDNLSNNFFKAKETIFSSLSENYSYTWGMNFMSNKDGDGNMLPNTQPVVTTSRLNYQNDKNSFDISFYYKWIGSYTPMQYNPISGEYAEGDKIYSYTLSNMKFTYKPLSKIECSLSIDLADYLFNEKVFEKVFIFEGGLVEIDGWDIDLP